MILDARLRWLLPLLALLVLVALPAVSAALTIDAATVAFNPKKSDSFVVKGRFNPFDVATVGPVTIEFGSFEQTIPLSAFVVKKGKLSFKGAKGAVGIAALTVDTVKGTFAAAGKNVALAPFQNPAPFHFQAGFVDDCATLTLAEGKKWTLAATTPACGFNGAPLLAPNAITVGVPTAMRVRVAVRDDLALDLGSLVLLRLDDGLNATGQVCTLHDDGGPAHGDDIAVDGIFSCRFTATEAAPTRLRFAVRALRDTVLVLSPSVFLDVVSPLTEAEVATMQTVQSAGVGLWEAAVAEHGEGKKALKQTVAGILALPGVATARIAGDGVNIAIEYASGLAGGIDLDPVGVAVPGVPSTLSARALAADEPVPPKLPTRDDAVGRAVSPLPGPRIGNDKVLIWSAFENENDQMAAATQALVELFTASTCPKFEVTLLKNEQCDLASIATFQSYGTVVLLTHGGQPQPKGPLGFMTREKATTYGTWFTHAEDLKLRRLLVYSGARAEKHDYFIFFPSYVTQVNPDPFPNSVIFAGACSSALNRSMANAFFGRGARAYFGFSDVTHATLLKVASVGSFAGMLAPAGSGAADAFARVPHRTLKSYLDSIAFDPKRLDAATRNTLKSELTLVSGDGRLGYPCGVPATGLIESVTIPAAPMANLPGVVGTVRFEAGVKYRLVVTGTARSQFEQSFGEYDAVYCFDNSSSTLCHPPSGSSVLLFYTQFADEEPDEIQNVQQFTNSSRPAYSSSHRYEFTWIGKEGRLWLKTFHQDFPDTGVDISGSFTVEIFRD